MLLCDSRDETINDRAAKEAFPLSGQPRIKVHSLWLSRPANRVEELLAPAETRTPNTCSWFGR